MSFSFIYCIIIFVVLLIFLIVIVVITYTGVLDQVPIEFDLTKLTQNKDPSWSTWEYSGSCARQQIIPGIITETTCISTYNEKAIIAGKRTCLKSGCRDLSGLLQAPGYTEQAILDCATGNRNPFVGLLPCFEIETITVRIYFPIDGLYLSGNYAIINNVTLERFAETSLQLWTVQILERSTTGESVKISQIRNGTVYGIAPGPSGEIQIGEMISGTGWLLKDQRLQWFGNFQYLHSRITSFPGTVLGLTDLSENASLIRLEVFN